MMGTNPWDENEGKYDRPSSGLPKVEKRGRIPDDFHATPEPCPPLFEVESTPGIAPGEGRAEEMLLPVAEGSGALLDPDEGGGTGGAVRSHTARLLLSFIERVERLNAEIADLQADRREVLAEAKATGFDVQILQTVIKRRKLDPAIREMQDAVLAVYEDAIGMTCHGAPSIEAMRDAAALAPPVAEAVKKKKPTTKDLALAEAAGWAMSGARH